MIDGGMQPKLRKGGTTDGYGSNPREKTLHCRVPGHRPRALPSPRLSTGGMGPEGARGFLASAKLNSAKRLTEVAAAPKGLLGRRRGEGETAGSTDALLTVGA